MKHLQYFYKSKDAQKRMPFNARNLYPVNLTSANHKLCFALPNRQVYSTQSTLRIYLWQSCNVILMYIHTLNNLWHKHLNLRVQAFFHKTVRVCHVYCNFKIGFTCRITVILRTLKDGSLLINTLASNICFSYKNIFQNGVDALPKIVDAFLSKSSNFHLVRIIR